MKCEEVFEALGLPAEARVERRVPKKMLAEHAANTPADRRHITDGLEEITWRGVMKPSNVGLRAFRDERRSYEEVVLVEATLREGGLATKLATLIHRAMAYPVVLVLTEAGGGWLSLAHKRLSQRETGGVVVDGDVLMAPLVTEGLTAEEPAFLASLALRRAAGLDLLGVYQRWYDLAGAWLVAGVTGRFEAAASSEAASDSRTALGEWLRLGSEISRMRQSAVRERQVARLVAINLEVKRLEAARADVRVQLEGGRK